MTPTRAENESPDPQTPASSLEPHDDADQGSDADEGDIVIPLKIPPLGDEDEHDDEGISNANKSTSTMESQNQGLLEKLLDTAELELSAIRTERDRQRQQLEQLQQEHDSLINQKELRQERHKLNQQMVDLVQSVDRRKYAHQLAQEGLEQTRTRHYQLEKTLKLLQASVENVLEQSNTDGDRTIQGIQRANQRQELLTKLLKADWKSQGSLASAIFDEDYETEEEEGDLTYMEESQSSPLMFFQKKKHFNSVESITTENTSIASRQLPHQLSISSKESAPNPPKHAGSPKSSPKSPKSPRSQSPRRRRTRSIGRDFSESPGKERSPSTNQRSRSLARKNSGVDPGERRKGNRSRSRSHSNSPKAGLSRSYSSGFSDREVRRGVGRTRSDSAAQPSRSKSRSQSNRHQHVERKLSRGSSQSRSRSGSASRTKSSNESRLGHSSTSLSSRGLRRSKSAASAASSGSASSGIRRSTGGGTNKRKTALLRMLENDIPPAHGWDDVASEDTPRTTNTNTM